VTTESVVPDNHADLARSATDEAPNEKCRCLPGHPIVDSDEDIARTRIEIRDVTGDAERSDNVPGLRPKSTQLANDRAHDRRDELQRMSLEWLESVEGR
jgi:hypothetical protein